MSMWEDILSRFYRELYINNEKTQVETESASEILLHVTTLVKKYPHVFNKISKPEVHREKCDSQSLEFRVEGNNFYAKGLYADAAVCYNKSICYAASSANLAIGHANRSAALCEIGRFRDAEKDILLARATGGLSDKLEKKLNDREKRCEKRYQRVSQLGQCNLSYAPHPNIPFIVNRLGIKEDGGKSWLYAREFVGSSAVVLKEELLNFLVTREGIYSSCHFCLKPNVNLIPCPNCTNTMFCNENCMSRANEEYHKWECPISDLLWTFDDILRVSFRMLIKMLHVLGIVEELENYWKHLPKQRIDWFSADRNKFSPIEHLKLFHSALHKTEFRIRENRFHTAIKAVSFGQEIMKWSELRFVFRSSEQRKLFDEIIYHHLLILKKLRVSILNGVETLNFGTVYGLSHTLIDELKTSESPNVAFVWHNNDFILRAIRPIQKGEFLKICPAGERALPQPTPQDFNDIVMMSFLNVLGNMLNM